MSTFAPRRSLAAFWNQALDKGGETLTALPKIGWLGKSTGVLRLYPVLASLRHLHQTAHEVAPFSY